MPRQMKTEDLRPGDLVDINRAYWESGICFDGTPVGIVLSNEPGDDESIPPRVDRAYRNVRIAFGNRSHIAVDEFDHRSTTLWKLIARPKQRDL